jgi:pimeloyl-ACP methyl ester carboxylesterase
MTASGRHRPGGIVAIALAVGVAVTSGAGLIPGITGSATALGPRPPASTSAVAPSRAWTVKTATLTVRDPVLGRLRFNTLVAGDPAQARRGKLVLFLHGFPETAESFREILPSVARAGYYAVAFSQRGYSPGARPLSIDAYSVINLVGDVTHIAASLGAPTFHLVGHDWGAGVAWVTAALYPKLVGSLTVLSTPDPDALSAAIADPRSRQHAASNYITTLRAPASQNRILANRVKGFKALFALGGGGLPATMVDVYARAMATPAALGAAINWYRANPFSDTTDRTDQGTDRLSVGIVGRGLPSLHCGGHGRVREGTVHLLRAVRTGTLAARGCR